MLNKVQVIGRLGANPELRYTQTGMPVCTLSVATDESYQDRDGNKVERTEWHRVVVFQKQAESCSKYLGKGSLVYVEGNLQTRKWQDQQGQDRYTTEIKAQRVQFLDKKGDNPNVGQGYNDGQYGRPSYQNQNQNQNNQYNQGGYNDGYAGGFDNSAPQQGYNNPSEDIGPAFPSEASGMDKVPF